MSRAWLALVGAVFCAAPALAQPAQPPVEPSEPARVQLGPVSVRPALILREVGYDSNVLHQSEEAQGDFTAGGITRSHERPTSEIDARASRFLSNLAVGTTVAAGSRTSLHVGVRQSNSEFDEDETFRGLELADQLNGISRSVLYGADVVLSPLTTISIHGEHIENRFDTSAERDANSYRDGVTATMQPLSLVSGRASIGMRAFRPLNAPLRDFTGRTAAIAVSYALHQDTRFGLTFDRGLRYSFAEATPLQPGRWLRRPREYLRSGCRRRPRRVIHVDAD